MCNLLHRNQCYNGNFRLSAVIFHNQEKQFSHITTKSIFQWAAIIQQNLGKDLNFDIQDIQDI